MSGTVRPFSLPKRPPGHLGSYALGVATQTAGGPAAGAAQFELRWTSTARLMVLTAAEIRMSQVTAAATGVPTFGLFLARSFTVSPTVGTAVVVSGSSLKKRTSYAATALGTNDARYGVGAAVTGSTRTLEADPIAVTILPGGASFEAADGPVLDLLAEPIILAANEGLVLSNMVSQTGGVTKLTLRLDWMELEASAEF